MIWVYGDSFACQPTEYNHLKSMNHRWPHMVAKHLSVKEKNFGLSGSSNDYSFYLMSQSFEQWKKHDTVIFCETHLSRKWWFKDKPMCSTYNNIMRRTDISERDKKWVARWFSDFYNEDVELLHLKSFYNQLNDWCRNLDIQCFVLRGFARPPIKNLSHINFSKGFVLNDLCFREYENPPDPADPDSRIGHFSTENHVLIAYRVLTAIKNKESIDMSQPLKENLYRGMV
jgi:hypothetical protein